MKGWELYAWQDGGDWQYSLLVGTNRRKSDQEITAASARLPTLEAVEARLSQLAPGQWVTLSPRAQSGPLPPPDVLTRLETWCQGRHLKLQPQQPMTMLERR